ncbi:large ribosomal subunit protein mL53 [Panulirus ornatus]|uniref:large ribosomal subunit protein mL53 n=1 Tax=Panulirus ornatus TaxID=150431 RepID=UPI003A87F053
MALPYTRVGTFTRSGGVFAALGKQVKLLNLQPVKKIVFTFDPFSENAVVVRNTLNYFHQERVRDTNPKCSVKVNVVSTRAEPNIEVKLVDGKTVLFKTKNLQSLEILQKFNQLISSQAKIEDKTPSVLKGKITKLQKKK